MDNKNTGFKDFSLEFSPLSTPRTKMDLYGQKIMVQGRERYRSQLCKSNRMSPVLSETLNEDISNLLPVESEIELV